MENRFLVPVLTPINDDESINYDALQKHVESVIKQGGYNLPDMLRKIDQYHVAGKLTDQERDELYAQARGGADPTGNLDLLGKVLELVGQVQQLQDRVTKLEQGDTGDDEQPEPEQAPADYVAGKWHRTGDRVTFEGTAYTCTAPAGQVCTWSPAEYPAYWAAD
jgi:hypothetical protein